MHWDFKAFSIFYTEQFKTVGLRMWLISSTMCQSYALSFLYFNADINECESDDSNNCHENANCTNTEGSYTCSCNPGYTGNGVNCTSKILYFWGGTLVCTLFFIVQSPDVNECELEIHTCNSNAICTDTNGSFNCTCEEGFEGDGFNCTGKVNWWINWPAVRVFMDQDHDAVVAVTTESISFVM